MRILFRGFLFICSVLSLVIVVERTEVQAAIKKPKPYVPIEEVDIQLNLEAMSVSAEIENNSEKYKVKKAEYIYEVENVVIEDISVSDADFVSETQTVVFAAENISKMSSKMVTVEGNFDQCSENDFSLKSIKIYSGNAVIVYDASTGEESIEWGTEDTTAPDITGWIGKDSHNAKDYYMTVYSDQDYDFTKYVNAEDDRDGKVSVEVDMGSVNWKKGGVYSITFIAEDKSGNVCKKKAKIQVLVPGEIEKWADQILSKIVKANWSDQKKAEAIYTYVRKNYSYVDSNDHASWIKSAKYGLRYHSGNCFVFYSVSRLLLTRCGIPNIEVKRSAGGGGHGHWWNYVYIKGNWYHFDATPRKKKAVLCLLTDEQLTAYSDQAGKSHIWNKSLYPKGAKKKIKNLVFGKNY